MCTLENDFIYCDNLIIKTLMQKWQKNTLLQVSLYDTPRKSKITNNKNMVTDKGVTFKNILLHVGPCHSLILQWCHRSGRGKGQSLKLIGSETGRGRRPLFAAHFTYLCFPNVLRVVKQLCERSRVCNTHTENHIQPSTRIFYLQRLTNLYTWKAVITNWIRVLLKVL